MRAALFGISETNVSIEAKKKQTKVSKSCKVYRRSDVGSLHVVPRVLQIVSELFRVDGSAWNGLCRVLRRHQNCTSQQGWAHTLERAEQVDIFRGCPPKTLHQLVNYD